MDEVGPFDSKDSKIMKQQIGNQFLVEKITKEERQKCLVRRGTLTYSLFSLLPIFLCVFIIDYFVLQIILVFSMNWL